jgi:hypothetical protein
VPGEEPAARPAPLERPSRAPATPTATPLLDSIEGLRAPWAAGIAGIAFAILFTLAMLLLRAPELANMSETALALWFARGADFQILVAATYLAPFAGIAFLWFIAVVRDQLREREGPFFGTVFLGSGLLFVVFFFAAAASIASVEVGVHYLGKAPPSPSTVAEAQALGYTFLFVFGTRAAALFVMSTATAGARTGAFPRWFSLLGYVIGIGMLVFVAFNDWSVLLLPAWVAVVSLFILRRERERRTSATPLIQSA